MVRGHTYTMQADDAMQCFLHGGCDSLVGYEQVSRGHELSKIAHISDFVSLAILRFIF